MYKSKSGSVEEWRISFNKWGMIMVHIEPRIKQQYSIKWTELQFIFHLVQLNNFEEF